MFVNAEEERGVGRAHWGDWKGTDTPGRRSRNNEITRKRKRKRKLTPGVDGDERRAGIAKLPAKRYRLPDGIEQPYLDEYRHRHRLPSGAHDVQHERSIVVPQEVTPEVSGIRGALGTTQIQVDRIATGFDESCGNRKIARVVRREVHDEGSILGYRLEFAYAGKVAIAIAIVAVAAAAAAVVVPPPFPPPFGGLFRELGGVHHGRVRQGGAVLATQESEGQFRRADHRRQYVAVLEREVMVAAAQFFAARMRVIVVVVALASLPLLHPPPLLLRLLLLFDPRALLVVLVRFENLRSPLFAATNSIISVPPFFCLCLLFFLLLLLPHPPILLLLLLRVHLRCRLPPPLPLLPLLLPFLRARFVRLLAATTKFVAVYGGEVVAPSSSLVASRRSLVKLLLPPLILLLPSLLLPPPLLLLLVLLVLLLLLVFFR